MFGSRRPGKRSIVGSRVCARQVDGFFRPAVIKSIAAGGPWQDGDRYAVEFQDGSAKTGLRSNEVVGAGFLPLTSDLLVPGQPVFITNNGREVKGVIVEKCAYAGSPSSTGDEFSVLLGGEGTISTTVQRRVDDIRLIESRRSARLSESQQDALEVQSPIAFTTECGGKRRSREVDVPSKHPGYKYSYGIGHCCVNGDGRMILPDGEVDMESETMDEHMAALVLTSLSCSPTSPVFANGATEYHAFQSEGSSSTSSGVWTMNSNSSNSPSPPKSVLSQSAPATVPDFIMWQHYRERSPSSERMGMEIVRNRRTVYQCTWPGCSRICDSCPLIEKHVREEHLRNLSERESLSDDSDHEEEFYYTEVEEPCDEDSNTMQSFTETVPSLSPSVMQSSSTFPEDMHQMLATNTALDHDYQRKEYRSKPLSIPRSSSFHANDTLPKAIPAVPEGQTKSSSSWQPGGQWNRYVVDSSSFSFGRTDTLSSSIMSPTSSKSSRKSRNNDIRKCRKVYGIENRSLWCTQCKWKKACTRFFDRHEIN